MDQKWSHVKVLGKYFEVYGQARPITPEAGEKKAPFLGSIFKFSAFSIMWYKGFYICLNRWLEPQKCQKQKYVKKLRVFSGF